MSNTADADEAIEVSADGLTVRKSFVADEFPVPAIRFEIESEREVPVSFRLVESIPESFPMDNVGFHPDYHSDDWTAFQDNHVEFTGTVDPGEPVVTVYGIRLDGTSNEDASAFLSEPSIQDVSTDDSSDPADGESAVEEVDDATIEGIISDDRNQVVKDMLAGDSDTVPGLEEADDEAEAIAVDDDLDLDLEEVDTEPVEVDDDGDEEAVPDVEIGFDEELPDEESDADAVEATDETGELETTDETDELEASDEEGEPSVDVAGAEPGVEDDGDGAAEETAASVDETEEDERVEPGASDGTEADTASSPAEETQSAEPESVEAADEAIDGTVGARLAAEIREDRLDEEDLEVLRSELDLDPKPSEVARIDHLQTRVEEVLAYADALEQFLDRNGTGDELVEEFRDRLASFESELAAVDGRLEAVEAGTDALEGDVEEIGRRTDAVESDVEAIDERVDDIDEDLVATGEGLSDLESTVEDATDDVSALEAELDGVTDAVDDLEEGVDEVEASIGDVEEVESTVAGLESTVEEVESDVESVREDVDDLLDWREQLGSMFSN